MADVLQAAKLRAVLAALREDLKPELTSPNARLRADLMDMLLTRLATLAEDDGGPEADGAAARADAAVIAAMDAARRAELEAAIARFVRAERDRRTGVEERVAAAATAAPSGRRSSGELALSAEQFTAYLKTKFPNDPGIRCTKVSIVPGGRSKGTILVDIEGRSTPSAVVLRRDFELSVNATSVADEYPVLKAAYDAGFPAPPPLWLEEDESAIGGKFIAFEKVAGASMGSLFASDAPPGFVRELAKALARLHVLDIDELGLGDRLRFARAENPVRAMLESFHKRYVDAVPRTDLMDAAFTYLWLQVDKIGNERRLVHGDASFHNTMGEGDRLTAVLDWEFVHAGDPAEDLTFCKYLAEKIIPWDEFMAVYYEAGGPLISPERMHFFQVWRTLHLSILTGAARGVFERAADQDLRIATIGYNTLPRQLRDLAGDLARAVGV